MTHTGPPHSPTPLRGRGGCGAAIIGLLASATVVFTLIGVLVAVGDDGSNAGPSASRTVEADGGETKTPKGFRRDSSGVLVPNAEVGEKAKDGKFTFTVTKVNTGVQSYGPRFLEETPQGQFVVVHVKVANHSDQPQQLIADNHKLLADGKEHAPDTEAMLTDDTFAEDINPGNSVKAKVVFDVPKDVTAEAVRLHDSAFSGGVEVSLS